MAATIVGAACAAAALATAALLAWTGITKALLAPPGEAVRAGLTAVVGGPGRAGVVLRLTGVAEFVVAAALLAAPPPVGGVLAGLLGLGFVGYLVRVRQVAPTSSCGCSGSKPTPVTWRSFARAGGVVAAGVLAAVAGTPWWHAAGSAPTPFVVAFLVAGAAYVAGSAEWDGLWLLPLRRLRVRLFGHPLAAPEGPVPVAATVELLEASVAWRTTGHIVRSSLVEHWPADGFRILRYAGWYEPGTGPRPVSVLFALDAEATRADPRGAVVRVSVVDDESGKVLPDPQLLVPAGTPVPAG